MSADLVAQEATPLIQAEQAVLGAILMTSGRVLDELTLTGEEFFRPAHETIYRAAVKLQGTGTPADAVTLSGALLTAGDLNRVGGPLYLHELLASVPTVTQAPHFARVVRDAFVSRRIAETGLRLAQHAASDTDDSQAALETARTELDRLASTLTTSDALTVAESIDDALEALDNPEEYPSTGWAELDHIIGGWRPEALYVVAARPGVGKSVFATQAATQAAVRLGAPVFFASLEMSRREINTRVLSALAAVDPKQPLGEAEWDRIAKARKVIDDGAPLLVDDDSANTPAQIRAKAKAFQKRHGLGLIVVDYLGLMKSGSRAESRQAEVAEMSRSMKLMARDLGAPVILLAQLNRESTKRADKRPAISDLRESGAIEQDADVVILLHREDDPPTDIQMIVAKSRQGPTAYCDMTFEGHYSRIRGKSHPHLRTAS